MMEVVFVNKIFKQMNLKGTAREKGIDYQMLYRRVKVKKMPLEEAIAECLALAETDEVNLSEIAREHGIDYIKFYHRIKKLGWTLEEAIQGHRHKAVKRYATPGSYKTRIDEPRGKAISFRPLLTQQEAINKALEESGETLQDWVLDAVIAKLEGRIIPRSEDSN